MINPAVSRARASLKKLAGITPFLHQSEAMAAMMEGFESFAGAALLHSPGCGKTYTSLTSFLELHARGDASMALAVCPLSVIGAWVKDGEAAGIEVLALTGTGAKKEAALQRKLLERGDSTTPLVVVVNYESTWRMEPLLKTARFDVVFADEVHRIKAAGTKQSRAMHRIGKSAKYRIGMTGSPAAEGALGYYGIFRFIDDRLFGTSYVNFTSRYAITIPLGTFKKVVVNQTTLPELERLVMDRSHRVAKEDALDLPPEMDKVIEFDMTPKARKLYDELRRDSLAEISDDFGELGEIVAETALTKMLRLQQLTGGFGQVDDGDLMKVDDAKLKALREVFEDTLADGGSVVCFHRFSAEGKAIEDVARSLGYDPSIVNGSVKGGDRAEEIRRFQEENSRIFIGQIRASGLGITLTAASTTVFYSLGFSLVDYDQARARIHRIGQDRPCTHVHLIARNTIDEDVYDALQKKQVIADQLTRGGWARWLQDKKAK